MGLHSLRALDERVLPRLARGLNRILGRTVPSTPGGTVPSTPDGTVPSTSGSTVPPDSHAPEPLPADAEYVPAGGAGRRGRVLGGVAVAGVVAVVTAAVFASGDAPPPDDTVGDVVRVGAVEGDQVPLYADRARAELRALVSAGTAEAYALVSLRGYATPTGVLPVLADVETVRAFVRMPVPGVQTAIESFGVRTPAADIPAAMARIADERETGAADDERTAARLAGNDAKEQELKRFYTESARLDRAEAAAYRQGCTCVYAVVVRATPLRLTQLAGRAGVRVVDPAPEVRRLDRTVFLPLLPEQTTVVAPPADRSLPDEPLGTPTPG
jgi:hypothetical protein